MACSTIICTILFALIESSKIILFKDLFRKIIEAKAMFFSVTLNLNIARIQFLSKIILDDSDKPNRIVQMNGLHATYSYSHINVYDVKVMYTIYPMIYISRHYGIFLFKSA